MCAQPIWLAFLGESTKVMLVIKACAFAHAAFPLPPQFQHGASLVAAAVIVFTFFDSALNDAVSCCEVACHAAFYLNHSRDIKRLVTSHNFGS